MRAPLAAEKRLRSTPCRFADRVSPLCTTRSALLRLPPNLTPGAALWPTTAYFLGVNLKRHTCPPRAMHSCSSTLEPV